MDNNWTTARNWVGNTLPNAGDDLLFTSGARHPQNENDFAPGTTFNSVELRGGGGGGYNISGNLIFLNAGIRVENNSGRTINHTINNALLLNSNQTFTVINSGGTFTLTGPADLNGKTLTCDVSAASETLVSGVLSSAGSLVKTGTGPLILTGNNNYTGSTRLEGGTLQINGSQPSSPVLLVAGNLTGIGTVGPVTSIGTGGGSSMVVRPGSSPGILSCSNVSLNASTFLVSQLNGTAPGSGYSQLNVRGSVSLGDAGLSLLFSFAPALGTVFVIVNNDAADAVIGTFSGLPEGAFLTQGFSLFRISYKGGDGNDVVIVRVNPPAQLTSVAKIVGGAVQIQGQGLPGLTYALEGAPQLNAGAVWSHLGAVTANGAGFFTFTDSDAPLFPRRFYRAVSP